MTLARTGNTGRAPLADRQHDLYETPAVAVRALLEAETLPRCIWEPACGRGAIARLLVAAGHRVYASDLIDYGYGTPGINFLTAREAPSGAEAIVTNPPYKDADEFVRRAIALAPLVVMLLRLSYLEATCRTDILECSGLMRVHVFRNRLPMMHRDGWRGRKNVSAMAFAWFIWKRGYPGRPTINRISWK